MAFRRPSRRPPETVEEFREMFPDVIDIEQVAPGHIVLIMFKIDEKWAADIREGLPIGANVEFITFDEFCDRGAKLMEHFSGN